MEEEQALQVTEDAPKKTLSRKTVTIAAILLAVPVIVPLLLIAATESLQGAIFMVMVSACLLMLNVLIFRLMYRWLHRSMNS